MTSMANRTWKSMQQTGSGAVLILLSTTEFGIRVCCLPVAAVDERRQFNCTKCHKLLLEYDMHGILQCWRVNATLPASSTGRQQQLSVQQAVASQH